MRQGIDLLRDLDDALYQRTAPPFYESSAGAHMRHIYDHCRQFLRGVGAGHVDYDAREREPRFEIDREFAIERLRRTVDAFETLSIPDDARVTVRLNSRDASLVSESTVARELQFLISHTVHHYALIAFVLRHEGVSVPAGFGVSPSTLEYQAARIRPAV